MYRAALYLVHGLIGGLFKLLSIKCLKQGIVRGF